MIGQPFGCPICFTAFHANLFITLSGISSPNEPLGIFCCRFSVDTYRMVCEVRVKIIIFDKIDFQEDMIGRG